MALAETLGRQEMLQLKRAAGFTITVVDSESTLLSTS